MKSLNIYGDRLISASCGHGADVASQRADDLDLMAIDVVRAIGSDKCCSALDAACGLGGQAIRLASAGASVVASDIADFADAVRARATESGVDGRISFVRADLRWIDEALPGFSFDVICCQRALHYLTWLEAVSACRRMAALLKPGGRLFLSASGLASELGEGYAGRAHDRTRRFAPLADVMADRHDIRGSVCLYATDDLEVLFRAAGLQPCQMFVSPFGNVKGVACRGG